LSAVLGCIENDFTSSKANWKGPDEIYVSSNLSKLIVAAFLRQPSGVNQTENAPSEVSLNGLGHNWRCKGLSLRPVLQLVLIEKGRQKHENNQINKNLKTPPVKVRTHRRLPEGGE
jgi:hypothetical protein